MNEPALTLDNVSLKIQIDTKETRTLKKLIVRSLTGGTLHKTKNGGEVLALKNISCTITKGERVALIGHNGAGKSTFLRVVSGIYKPTTGRIIAGCPVYPMIQKAFITGPDLSGAEAARAHYLLTHSSLKGFEEYLQDIVDFSELGDYIYMPMKGYSEGMASRLLFSMLTSEKHECLALDEGFGAGDARFFDRAQRRLGDFIGNAGTLILASHSDGLLREFCRRGLVFKQGAIVFDGQLEQALSFYHEHL